LTTDHHDHLARIARRPSITRDREALRAIWIGVALAFLLSLTCQSAHAQPPFPGPPGSFRGPGPNADWPAPANDPLTLLANEAVRRELHLTDDQKPAIEQMLRDYQDERRKSFGVAPPSADVLDSLPADEREWRWSEFRDRESAAARSAAKGYLEKCSKVLTAEQLSRIEGVQSVELRRQTDDA
jgi:hypothetical protein